MLIQRARLPWRSMVLGAIVLLGAVHATQAADAPDGAGPLMNLLKSGRLPKERLAGVVKLVCQRGNAEELGFVFEQTLRDDAFPSDARRVALEGLIEAAANRKIQPAGDLTRLKPLLETGKDKTLRLLAVRLAGAWKVKGLLDSLRSIVVGTDVDDQLRQTAIDSLAGIGGTEAKQALQSVTDKDRPLEVRYLGVAALAKLDAELAASRAVDVFIDGPPQDPTLVMSTFLNLKGGPEKLAAAIQKKKPPVDVAKVLLRGMYAIGSSDASLTAALSDAAGINLQDKPVTDDEVNSLVSLVLKKGDPARGEMVFRRADLSCMKCHSINGAGGEVGPDLRALGSVSPPDYVVKSVLIPDQAIKEEFITVKVITTEGEVLQGIVVDENEERLILKDATGVRKTIPIADIEDRAKGGSLMPKGLANFLTEAELVDLARFLSELGKPGPYAIPTAASIRRFKVLKIAPEALIAAVPDGNLLREHVLDAPSAAWVSAYSTVSGALPLEDLVRLTRNKVLYIQGEVEVTAAGPVGFRVSPSTAAVWIDEEPTSAENQIVSELTQGRHKVTIRVDASQPKTSALRVDLFKPDGSAAEFTAVGGP